MYILADYSHSGDANAKIWHRQPLAIQDDLSSEQQYNETKIYKEEDLMLYLVYNSEPVLNKKQ
jgi:hypothetical protein